MKEATGFDPKKSLHPEIDFRQKVPQTIRSSSLHRRPGKFSLRRRLFVITVVEFFLLLRRDSFSASAFAPKAYFGSRIGHRCTDSSRILTTGRNGAIISIDQQLERPTLLVNDDNWDDFEKLSSKFSEFIFDSEEEVEEEEEKQREEKFPLDDDNWDDFEKLSSKFSEFIFDSEEEVEEERQQEEVLPKGDPSSPVCRVVTLSDSKLPTATSALPAEVSKSPHILRRLDDIYHSIAHGQTRSLKYGAPDVKNQGSDNDENELVSVTRASLEDAGFRLLSRRDLDLCEALNAGYLLRLSIAPDVSELDPALAQQFYPDRFDKEGNPLGGAEEVLFDGRVLVFWRGYSQEVSQGRLLLPKLDYLQASLVQRSASWLRTRLNVLERWFTVRALRIARRMRRNVLRLGATMLENLPNENIANSLRKQLGVNETDEINQWKVPMPTAPGKIFQLARYGGSEIRFVGSPNPTDALNPFVICEEEYCPPCLNARDRYLERLDVERPAENVERDMYYGLNKGGVKCPYDSVPARRKAGPMPPMQLLKRVTIGSLVDIFSSEGRRHLWKTIFSKSQLVEPTYEEVVVVWRPLPTKDPQEFVVRPPRFVYEFADMFDIDGLPEPPKPASTKTSPNPLDIRSFSGVPMANLPAVLPKTKLIFRPADAFVFDSISIFSFLLIVGSQKFNSPKLDLLALVSVSLWVIRTVLRYSNKLARYDLLVKKFLTSKISHRNQGALKYITTEAGSQRAVRASLVHSWLSGLESDETIDRSELLRRGEAEINDLIEDYKNIPVDVDAGLSDLETLGLASFSMDGMLSKVVRGSKKIRSTLKEAWIDVLDGKLKVKPFTGQRP